MPSLPASLTEARHVLWARHGELASDALHYGSGRRLRLRRGRSLLRRLPSRCGRSPGLRPAAAPCSLLPQLAALPPQAAGPRRARSSCVYQQRRPPQGLPLECPWPGAAQRSGPSSCRCAEGGARGAVRERGRHPAQCGAPQCPSDDGRCRHGAGRWPDLALPLPVKGSNRAGGTGEGALFEGSLGKRARVASLGTN